MKAVSTATAIADLGLRTWTRRVLLEGGIRSLPGLLSVPLQEGKSVFKIPARSHLRALPEVGPKMEREILAALDRAGLELAAPKRPSEDCRCPACTLVFGPRDGWRGVYARLGRAS